MCICLMIFISKSTSTKMKYRQNLLGNLYELEEIQNIKKIQRKGQKKKAANGIKVRILEQRWPGRIYEHKKKMISMKNKNLCNNIEFL